MHTAKKESMTAVLALICMLYLIFSLHGDHLGHICYSLLTCGYSQDPFDKAGYHSKFKMQITAGEFRLLNYDTLVLSEVTSVAGR